jgi:hypothetical protein
MLSVRSRAPSTFTHTDLHDRPRSIDAIDVATLARSEHARHRPQNHYESTAGLAFIVRKVVPTSRCSAASI